MLRSILFTLFVFFFPSTFSWTSTVVPFRATKTVANHNQQQYAATSAAAHSARRFSTASVFSYSKEKDSATVEQTTEKFGLEAGLFQSMKQKEGGTESARSLLNKYGIAYLATSIPLALLSFAICYGLVDHGVDVGSLLARIGIQSSPAGETAGTFAIAYAAHKAASPIRFPPTVLLTPLVAKWIGKKPNVIVEEEDASQQSES